jgi:hypothetical protein
MNAIVKNQPRPDVNALILAYRLMFARAPRRAEPDEDRGLILATSAAQQRKSGNG